MGEYFTSADIKRKRKKVKEFEERTGLDLAAEAAKAKKDQEEAGKPTIQPKGTTIITTPSGAKLRKTIITDPDGTQRVSFSQVDEPVQSKVAPTIDLTKQRAPIQLQPKEKTGISKLREEDSVVGSLVRAATDWRTTVALVGTLAIVVGGAALIAGAGARAAGAVVPKGILQVAKQVNVNAIGKAAGLTSKQTAALAVQVGRERINVIARYAVNPKSTALTTSILTKAGMVVGVAGMVGVTVGTYPFANFELAEATDKIGIAIFKAADAGDLEEVERLQEYLEEMVNPSVWESIVNKIPYANVMQNVSKNIAAAQVSAKSIFQSLQKKLADAEAEAEEPTFAEERETADIEARERKEQWREEDKEYWEDIEEEKKKTKKAERKEEKEYFEDIEEKKKLATKEEREEDKTYYEDIAEKKRATELREREEDKVYWEGVEAKRKTAKEEERAADDAYWKNIIETNAKRKADERAADEAYWAEIKGEALDDEDKKIIDEWNKGKSALNFKWLGL